MGVSPCGRVPSDEGGGGSCVGAGVVALRLPMGEIPTYHAVAPAMPAMALDMLTMGWAIWNLDP
jgi:hypothetical protein